MDSDDWQKIYIAETRENFKIINKKLDVLYEFRWRWGGATFLLAGGITAVIQLTTLYFSLKP